MAVDSDTPARYLFRILVAVSETRKQRAVAFTKTCLRPRGKRGSGGDKTGEGSCADCRCSDRAESLAVNIPHQKQRRQISAYSSRLSTWGTEYARVVQPCTRKDKPPALSLRKRSGERPSFPYLRAATERRAFRWSYGGTTVTT